MSAPVDEADPGGAGLGAAAAVRLDPTWERRLGAAAVAVAVAAVAWSCLRSASGWVPTTDWSLIELQVRDVWTSPPLLGAPSSVGFHHPGPLAYLVLAPLYVLFGSDPQALLLAAGALSCASVAAVGATAWRRGGLVPTLAVVVVVVWLAGSLPAGSLVDPWNPWVAVLPFAWLLVLVWSVLDDDLAMLPLAVLAGSFVVQAHIAYLVPVGALALLVVASLAWRARAARRGEAPDAGDGGRSLLRWGGAALLVGVVLWVPPLIEQGRGDPGNVTLAWQYASGDEGTDQMPARDALGVAAAELGWPGPWITGDEPVEEFKFQIVPASWWRLGLVLAGLAGAGALARGRRSAAHLVAVAGVAWIATALAIARLEVDKAFTYAVRFAWVSSAAVGMALVVAAAGWLLARRPAAARPLAGVLAAALAIASLRVVAVGGDAAVPVYLPEARALEVGCVDQLVPAALAAAGGAATHVQLAEFWPVHAGPVLNELDRAGVPVSVDERFGFFVERFGRPPTADEVQLVVATDAQIDEWQRRPDAVELARCAVLSDDELAEVAELEARDAAGTAEPLDGVRLVELYKRAGVTALFVVDGP